MRRIQAVDGQGRKDTNGMHLAAVFFEEIKRASQTSFDEIIDGAVYEVSLKL